MQLISGSSPASATRTFVLPMSVPTKKWSGIAVYDRFTYTVALRASVGALCTTNLDSSLSAERRRGVGCAKTVDRDVHGLNRADLIRGDRRQSAGSAQHSPSAGPLRNGRVQKRLVDVESGESEVSVDSVDRDEGRVHDIGGRSESHHRRE